MTVNPTIVTWRIIWAWLFLATICRTSFAFEHDLKIEPFAHATWGANEGAPQRILAITQTPDGYLWIGSADGLFRFDGLTFERYQAQPEPSLPADRGVESLLALPNGDLWIGFNLGAISLLRNGHAVNYGRRDGVPTGTISCFAQDQAGVIWAGSEDGLARLENNHWKEVGREWNFPGTVARALYVDRVGTLWVATKDLLVFLPRGTKTFQSTGIHVGRVAQIIEAPNGKLWMAETTRSVRPVPLHSRLTPSDETEVRVGSQRILFSREGDLWITTLGDGLRRIPDPERLKGKPGRLSRSIESYTLKDRLSDDFDTSIFQDRDANIWVGTDSGLDRFRKTPLLTIDSPTELHNADLVEGDDGDIWINDDDGNVRIHDSKIYTETKSIIPPPVAGAYREPSGRIWWICSDAIVQYDHGHFTQYPLPKGIKVRSHAVNVTGERSGLLWIYLDREGLYSWKKGVWTRFDMPSEFARLVTNAAFTDDRGRIWFGGEGGTIFYLSDGRIHTVANSDKHPPGAVRAIEGRNGHVWFGGLLGLTYFDGNRLYSVSPTDADSFGVVLGIEETSDGSLWILEHRGVIHIEPSEVRKFLEMPKRHVGYEVFDSDDGLPGRIKDRVGQNEIQDTEGHLWFVATDGIASLNPSGFSRIPQVSSAYIQSVIADGQRHMRWRDLKLAAGIKNLQINYTAASLTYPRRAQFRYKLDGVDTEWQDVGSRRTAYYTNLHPGKYQFHVTAGSKGRGWNTNAAMIDFTIPPFWFQTTWFRVFCGTVVVLVLWILYQLRLRQMERQFSLALGTRVDERVRIAQELHDTLLQSFHGLMFQFQAARNLLPRRPEFAMHALDEAILATEQAIAEGRDAIRDLRPELAAQHDLAELLTAVGKEMADTHASNGHSPGFRVIVEGKPQRLSPTLQDEIYRIGREVIRNAFHHAVASRIEVEVRYDEHQLRLRIRDDGKGLDPKVLEAGGSPGHWGLQGMRERAQRIGSQFEFWSEAGAGTEVELRVPAALAYEKQHNGNRFRLFHRGGKKGERS